MKLGGDVAIEVTRELATPLRELRERLGTIVDHLERYVATSTGPTPYPWRSLQTLRHDLAESYLDLTHLARRVDELDQALAPAEVGSFEVSPAVDLGLRLAAPQLVPGPDEPGLSRRGSAAEGQRGVIEQLFDLGNAAPARGVGGTLALLVTQLVSACAASAREIAGSTLSVRVAQEDAFVVVTIADNGNGNDRATELGELARSIVAPWGGSADAASAQGRGCSFEIRLSQN
jgi:signal transduction histidine kinase